MAIKRCLTRWVCVVVAAILLLPPGSALGMTDSYVARPFRFYYRDHQGMRVLGYSRSLLIQANGYPAQYFEKGRIEDHRRETADPTWAIMYGRLSAELMEQAPWLAVNSTSMTYADLARLANPDLTWRHPTAVDGPAPVSGPTPEQSGMLVPYSSDLRAAPGYIVPAYFWSYINRADLFPGGWLHDIGLPMTDAFAAQTVKAGAPRTIIMQAFERTVLTYDPLNLPVGGVERGNIGTDALSVTSTAQRRGGTRRIEVNLAEQWLYAYEGETLVYDAPVSTGRDGWETPAGHFRINRKLEKTTMRGNERGESWEVPDVPHVMYFTNEGHALHGAYWHNEFGTGVRRSHGCVNLPLDDAAALYAWAPIGTEVWVHDGSGKQSLSDGELRVAGP
jgi:lipoprotein-anchoring transpeptidase ErfK/SrfK